MTLDQRFQLERTGANSQIKLKAILRILTVEKPKPKDVSSPPPQVKQQQKCQANQASNGSVPTASVATSSSPALSSTNNVVTQAAAPAQSPAPVRAADSQNGSNDGFSSHSRGPTSESGRSPPSASSIRRAIRKHQGSFGEIHLTVHYATLRNKLIILVNACRNLFPCSQNGTDSYVRLYLLPDQTWRHRKRTHVKRKTVDPEYNDKFDFDVTLEEAQTRKLDVAVKNNKMFHTRERKDIGMVLLDLSQLDLVKGVTDWYKLTLPGLKTMT